MRAEQIIFNYVVLIMRYLKEGGKILGYMMLSPIVGLLIYLGYAHTLGRIVLGVDIDGLHTVYLVSNGVHVDICVPANADPEFKDWFPPSQFNYNGTPELLSFGWGDKGFYIATPTWADLKASTTFNALFVSSPTAMHVTIYSYNDMRSSKIRAISVSKAQLDNLCKAIKADFVKDQEKIIHINCCAYSGAANCFYEAKGSYNLIWTCNQWANATLRKAGLKHKVWAPFEWCLMDLHEKEGSNG